MRFDPIESRHGLKIWIDGVASLAPGERAPLGFRAGDDGEYIGVVNHFINFFEGGSVNVDQPPRQLTIRFLDGATERTEQHTIEGHPLPKGGIKLKISPGARQSLDSYLEFSGIHAHDRCPKLSLGQPAFFAVTNAQIEVENTMNELIAKIRYVHRDGETLTIPAAPWYQVKQDRATKIITEGFKYSVDLAGGEMQSFVIVIVNREGNVISRTNEMAYAMLKPGKWTAHVTVESQGKVQLTGAAVFTIFNDNRLQWDQPAFRILA